jgi:hypothetical protein
MLELGTPVAKADIDSDQAGLTRAGQAGSNRTALTVTSDSGMTNSDQAGNTGIRRFGLGRAERTHIGPG